MLHAATQQFLGKTEQEIHNIAKETLVSFNNFIPLFKRNIMLKHFLTSIESCFFCREMYHVDTLV